MWIISQKQKRSETGGNNVKHMDRKQIFIENNRLKTKWCDTFAV